MIHTSWAPAKCKLFLWLAVLDGGPIGQERITSPNPLPLVWSGRWDGPASAYYMCPCSRILVTDSDSFGTARLDSHKAREIIRWLVAKSNQENSKGEEEGAEHNDHSRFLDPLEAPKCLHYWGVSPCITRLLEEFRDKYHLWCLAGAHGLRTLGLGHGVGLG